ncbi:hypothetical protein [Nocardioides sp. 1609]|uniref:hypothetical protein n=1 Tax=Nocardioides sp. 1609 TaxID=2508327 RepID=UPI00107032FC|nr:hypothetical protein [Nocardioides sp. 1609]
MKLWKWLGLAGVAGVAATGAVIARDQRRRAQVTPEEVRDRLHERLAESDGPATPDHGSEATS